MSARPPDRNLALELVRVTESAALAAGRWVGRGDKIAADQAAGLPDAPWPPVYPKMDGEPPRVAPSRAKKPKS